MERDTVLSEDAERQARVKTELYKKNAVSEDDMFKTKAVSESLKRSVKVDQANIEKANLDVEYCSIKTPIDGRAGDILTDEGSIIKANDQTLIVINQIKPVSVSFAIPQAYLNLMRKHISAKYLEAMLAIAKQSPEKAIQMEAKGIPSFLSTWARFTLSAKDAAGAWEYTATQPLDLAMTQTAAVLLDPTVKPGLELFADVVEGKLYIAAVTGRSPTSKFSLEGAAPQDVMIASISCDGKPEELRVTVKDEAGKTVYQVAGAPDFFWPSVKSGLILQSKAKVALPAKGKYHVEATVNTGPLGGELTVAKDVVCK